MKKIYAIFILFFVLCACATGQKKNEIVVCGDDKVWIVNVDNSEGKNLDIVWKWNAQESNIPDDFKKYFRGMDECKTAKMVTGYLHLLRLEEQQLLSVHLKNACFMQEFQPHIP